MAHQDGASNTNMSSEVTVEQLLEEKLALQAQNAQLWRLVDKQRSMILNLQKDLDKANATNRNERKRASTGTEAAAILPYPTTPVKGEGSQRMPSAPDVIEDYDDASTTTEQSPDAHILASANKAKAKRSSPRLLDYHHGARLAESEPPVKSPLRSATNVRNSKDLDVHAEQPLMPDGVSAPMSPALTLRLQQVNRVVSPLTQSFQNTTHDRTGMEEVERVNIPRRERVRSPISRSTSDARIPQPPLNNSGTLNMNADSEGRDATTSRPQTPAQDSRPSSTLSPPQFPRTTISKSESGGTLADIAGPYYSESTSFLPLPDRPASQQSLPNLNAIGDALPPSRLAHPMSPESEYDEGMEDSARPSTPPRAREPKMALEPAAEFLPTPIKHVWEEHSPERLRSGSITSMVSDSSLRQSDTSPSIVTVASAGVAVDDISHVKISLMDCKSSLSMDIGVFNHDMFLLHKLRKSYAGLLGLQASTPLRSGPQLPQREVFDSQGSEQQSIRRAAIDLWFQALQDHIKRERDSQAAATLSSFLSADIVPTGGNASLAPTLVSDPSKSRSTSISSMQPVESTQPRHVKEGFLKKRGKNFGGWRMRYFILDGPIMRFYETPGGSLLGTIKLPMAQIGRQQTSSESTDGARDSDAQRHAFLILEPKKRNTNSFVRHILCASSDTDRDEWINALLMYVQAEDSSNGQSTLHDDSRSIRSESDKRGSYKNLSLTTPTRGTPYEANQPSPLQNTNDNFAAIGYGATKPGKQPIFDPKNELPSSPGYRAALDTDAVAISRPMNGAPIDNNLAWGATSLSSNATTLPPQPNSGGMQSQNDKKVKKKSFWSFGKGHDTAAPIRDMSSLKSPSIHDLTFAQQLNAPQTSGIFGVPLSEAVQIGRERGFQTGVPNVVTRCIDYLDLKHAEQEEGIYRLSGSNTTIKGLKERFNQEIDINLAGCGEYFDIHAIAGLLKLYLRELPSSILTQDLQRDFLDIIEVPEGLARTITVRTLVHSLPRDNFELLKILSRHLGVVVNNSDMNKMTLRNVGIVFSPTLNIPATVFSLFIAEYEALFEDRPEDISRKQIVKPFNDASSIRSTRSNNPTAAAILDTEQSYDLLQQDYSTAPSSQSNPYGLSDHTPSPLHQSSFTR